MSSESLFVEQTAESSEASEVSPGTSTENLDTEPDTEPLVVEEPEEPTPQVTKDPKAKPWPTGKRQPQAAVNLTSDKDWLAWVQSDLVKVPWIELWNDYLRGRPHLKTGVCLNAVVERLKEGEADDKCRFSIDTLDKSAWDKYDHHARFMWRVADNNIRSNRGVFYGNNKSPQEIALLIWGLKEWLIFLHSPGQIDKRNGGTAIFGTGRG
ncbi:hypothetical protein ASPCAL11697 [Aspergillus calidoustus]|uniref:Uncharacterized protein n=1 Tax=Aspergillus calidoustus TaxID=454130 RepID=A0A0U5H3T4_ASPCI|nr:hypothetical protein ASPCAL11697 [Aspergillus calidoustus]